ncbi:class I SAM-dependent methyltransferase [Stieleria varia]|uniref:Uncharacterized protein n=1 Tax=Stieleria varia TaxID=2528005 RepID=A0A5C6A069_9BACT|nr:class I SAM-dependent methyltransferase [Stieleria varia]TWT92806.1 hypothetical protein Pla52n_61710 [Stieleria varia]
MKNESDWKPGKYVLRGSSAVASRDPALVGVSSRLIGDLVARLYAENLPRHSRGRLLDVGCGTVPLYALYRPHVAEVVCVDWQASPHNVQHLDVEHDLSQPLPFGEQEFDTVLLSDVLEHIPTPDALIKDIARILSPGGKLILNVPFYYCIHESPHDYYRYTEFALKRFVSGSGLQMVRLEAIGGIPEVVGDLAAKTLSMTPVVGRIAASFVQWFVARFVRTGIGKRISQRTSPKYPLGYFLVAQKPQ